MRCLLTGRYNRALGGSSNEGRPVDRTQLTGACLMLYQPVIPEPRPLAEFIAHAKANPGKISMASAGNDTLIGAGHPGRGASSCRATASARGQRTCDGLQRHGVIAC